MTPRKAKQPITKQQATDLVNVTTEELEAAEAIIDSQFPEVAEQINATAKRIVESAKTGGNIFDKATLLVLNFEGIGNSRKIKTAQLEAQADFEEDLVNASKKLFKCDEYQAIKSSEAEMRAFVNRKALPSYFQRGTYLVPNRSIPTVVEKLKEVKASRDEKLVPAFIARYDEIVAANMKAQGDLANPTDYESRDVVRAKFAMDWHWVRFSVAGSLEGIDAQLYEEEKQKAKATWTAAANEMVTLVRATFIEIIEHVLDRLSGGEDGKPKIFKNSLVENLNAFLSDFEERNDILDDEKLATLVNEMRQVMDGVDAEELRDSKRTRKQVVEKFTEVKKTLDAMMEEKPDRAFSFDNI